jgi:hypothetical protein
MDDQVLQKVKECAISFLGVNMDDIVSVAEVFNDATTQGFEVSVQGEKVPSTEKCFVLVKDGEASILATKENGDEQHEQQH